MKFLVLLLILSLPHYSYAQSEECNEPSQVAALTLPYQAVASSLLNTPFENPEDILNAFDSAGSMLRAQEDQRGLFLEIYAATIRGVFNRIEDSKFENPEWVRKLLVNYANIYRDIINNELTGNDDAIPSAWKGVFKVTNDDKKRRSSEIMAAMIAHISRDMVHALLASDTDFKSKSIKRDYSQIAEALKEQTPVIWEALRHYGKGKSIIPSKIEEKIVVSWAIQLRKDAWEMAKDGSRTKTPEDREKYLNRLERYVTGEVKGANRLGFLIH